MVANLQTKPMDSDTYHAEATNAVTTDSSSRTRRETARTRNGVDERGGPGADRSRSRRRASA